MEQEKIYKLGFILMGICLIAGIALAGAYHLTRGIIEERARDDQLQALRIVLPLATRFSGLERGSEINFYRGLDDTGTVVGYAFQGEAKGYSSMIKVMVGVDTTGTVAGIQIVEQKETPGLGTKAVEVPTTRTFWQALLGRGAGAEPGRPWFEDQFAGKMVKDLHVVTGPTDTEIQALTGATITSRAVTDAVRESVEAFLKEQKEK